jgi:hypothetical protein
VLGGGFGLWLGDNIAILSMVKRAHLLFLTSSAIDVDAQEKYDVKNQEGVMLIKLSVTNKKLLEVQDGDDAFLMWGNLLKMHETSNKGRLFFLKNMLFSIKMDKIDSLLDRLLKIKDIRVTNKKLLKVQDVDDAFLMWGNLLKMHETSNKGRVFFLKNMLFSIKMEKFDSLLDHLLKIKNIRDQMKPIDKTMEEDMVVITSISLSSPYANVIQTLNITNIDKDLTFEQASTKLLHQDKQKKQFGNSSVNEAFEVALAAKFKHKDRKYRKEIDGDNSYVFMAQNKEYHVDSRVSRHFTNIDDWYVDFEEDKS